MLNHMTPGCQSFNKRDRPWSAKDAAGVTLAYWATG